MFHNTLKSGTCAALSLVLLISFANKASGQPAHQATGQKLHPAHLLALSQDPVWKSLLHLQRDDPQIIDPDFLLSWPRFSPEAEMLATLNLLEKQGQAAACRFPARTLWLQIHGLVMQAVDTNACPEIQEFQSKAPFDSLELVFADETVTQPASILGHSFLNLKGARSGKAIEHAVSFYTHAETINLPKLLWETLVTGKDGVFALTPWAIEEKKYLEDEQRNLWRYEVKTTPFQRMLIRNHLFELRHTRLTYYFHHFNCATVLHNILGLTGNMPFSQRQWTTPKDVVKDLHDAGLVVDTHVQLADAWLTQQVVSRSPNARPMRALLLSKQSAKKVTGINSWDPTEKIAWHAYNRWLHKRGQIDASTFEINTDTLIDSASSSEDSNLTLEPSLNPRFSEGETSLKTQWQHYGKRDQLLLKWTPVSHSLMQSHAQASAETELELLSPTISVDQDQARLHSLDIFSMKSLIPWDPLLQSKSTQTLIAYGRLTGHPAEIPRLHATFQLGFTHRAHDVDWFALIGPGLKTAEGHKDDAFIRSDLGSLWRHGNKSKTRLTWTSWSNLMTRTHKVELEQAWFLRENWVLNWQYTEYWRFNTREKSTGLSLLHSF